MDDDDECMRDNWFVKIWQCDQQIAHLNILSDFSILIVIGLFKK